MKLLKIVIIALMTLQLLVFIVLLFDPFVTLGINQMLLNTSMLVTIVFTPLFNFLVLLLLLLLLRKVEKLEKKKAEVPEPPF
jgi:hypothetical protein